MFSRKNKPFKLLSRGRPAIDGWVSFQKNQQLQEAEEDEAMREAHADMVNAAGSRATLIAPGGVPGLEDRREGAPEDGGGGKLGCVKVDEGQ